jgi:hypothetical protein
LERDQCGDHSTGHIVTGKCLPDAVGRGGRRDAAGRWPAGIRLMELTNTSLRALSTPKIERSPCSMVTLGVPEISR